MINLDEYKTLEESFHKGKRHFWKSFWLVIKGMLKWRRFIFIYTDMERSDKDYDLHIYWYGLNSEGVKRALKDLLNVEKQMDSILKNAKDILKQ